MSITPSTSKSSDATDPSVGVGLSLAGGSVTTSLRRVRGGRARLRMKAARRWTMTAAVAVFPNRAPFGGKSRPTYQNVRPRSRPHRGRRAQGTPGSRKSLDASASSRSRLCQGDQGRLRRSTWRTPKEEAGRHAIPQPAPLQIPSRGLVQGNDPWLRNADHL